MSRIIGIVSAKGGAGKTVVTLNLAAALMKFNKDVVAIDTDLNLSGLSLQLGVYHFPLTLNDVLNEDFNILQALYIHPSGLRIIPASLCTQTANLSRLKEVLNSPFLADKLILVDTPPGLEQNALTIMEACNEIILVTLPEIPSVTDMMKALAVAREFNLKVLGIIVNKFIKNEKRQISLREIEAVCELPVIGAIPEDKLIRKSIFERTPAVFVDPYSRVSIEFMKIAAKLVGENFYKPPRLVFLKKLLGGRK